MRDGPAKKGREKMSAVGARQQLPHSPPMQRTLNASMGVGGLAARPLDQVSGGPPWTRPVRVANSHADPHARPPQCGGSALTMCVCAPQRRTWEGSETHRREGECVEGEKEGVCRRLLLDNSSSPRERPAGDPPLVLVFPSPPTPCTEGGVAGNTNYTQKSKLRWFCVGAITFQLSLPQPFTRQPP